MLWAQSTTEDNIRAYRSRTHYDQDYLCVCVCGFPYLRLYIALWRRWIAFIHYFSPASSLHCLQLVFVTNSLTPPPPTPLLHYMHAITHAYPPTPKTHTHVFADSKIKTGSFWWYPKVWETAGNEKGVCVLSQRYLWNCQTLAIFVSMTKAKFCFIYCCTKFTSDFGPQGHCFYFNEELSRVC